MQQRLGSTGSLVRVLVSANSVVVLAGLEALIATSPVLQVVGSVTNKTTLLQEIEQQQPDVVLLELADRDHELPILLPSSEMDGPAFVILTDDWEQLPVAEWLRSGVQAVLPADANADEILETIQAVAIGLTVIHPDLLDSLLGTLPSSRSLPTEPDQTLTNREIEVLKMLAEGLGNKAIARRLNISEHTVKFHIGSIFSKLNASSRTEAVILGARQGVIVL